MHYDSNIARELDFDSGEKSGPFRPSYIPDRSWNTAKRGSAARPADQDLQDLGAEP